MAMPRVARAFEEYAEDVPGAQGGDSARRARALSREREERA